VDSPPATERVLALSQQLTANATTRQEAVNAVVAYLRSHETYRLDSPVPDRGEDAVDNFLFRSHTGFCEQFASAAAVLLQASGVPARVIVGYASGQQQQDGSWVVRGSDAHAWIEVYYPRVGWLPVDPTAGVPLAADGSSRQWQVLAVAAAVVLIAGLIAAAFAAVRRRRARRADPLRHSLTVLDAALGSARRRPTESLRDLAARVPLSPPERAALNTAEQAFYGRAPLDATEISVAAATMRRTARRVRRQRVIPRRRPPIA
jgi:transglutaminase-like putative cysteine protease